MGLFGPKDITGIDVGAGSIKAVRIKPESPPKLVAAGMVDLSPESAGESPGADLRYLLAEKNVGHRNVVAQMPGKDLTIRSLVLPRMPSAELREAVRWEAKRHISYPLDAALVEYLITGERREGAVEKYDLVMVAAEEARVRDRMAVFDEAGVRPSALDANALALRNLLRLRPDGEETGTLVVDIGASQMEINIYKGSALRFSRCLETGGADMTRIVADRLNIGVSEAETVKRSLDMTPSAGPGEAGALVTKRLDALLTEIGRSVEYYRTAFREKGVDRAFLAGGSAMMKGLPEYFSHTLGLPVELLDPFGALASGDALREEYGSQGPRFAVAVGLALRGM